MRGHITGVTSTSLWTRYAAGERVIDGHRLPDGIRKNTPLSTPIITPTTKGADGAHDEPLSCADVVERGLVDATTWERTMDGRARGVPSRAVDRRRRRADPRRHQVRVRDRPPTASCC